ncbi:Uncharacterized protein SCF082_LOCUS26637, partial [Durusdinium trenchii]
MREGKLISGEDPNSDSEETSHADNEETHTRTLDPSDPDVYLDALFGPLYFKLERIRKGGDPWPRFSDYRLVCIFLLLNLFLQLAIALKIRQVGLQTYGDVGDQLMSGTCWRVSNHPQFIGVLYPEEFEGLTDSSSFDFDCSQPILTLSMFPGNVDLNHDGFWSSEEVKQKVKEMIHLGSAMAEDMPRVFTKMAKYDKKNRPGSRSSSTGASTMLDMEFFKHYKGHIQVCLASDKNLCGNLEATEQLPEMLPGFEDPDDRLDECEAVSTGFCNKIFGKNYRWIREKTSELCGDSSFEREGDVNLVKYSAVSTYKGESDSILGKTFVSFLILLLFIWVMLLLSEFRYIWNFFQVIWSIPSTDNVDPNIASAADDGKFTVTKLPLCHKVFALLAIGVPRLVIACVVLYVGANFLAITNTLQDLVLNCTALGFLLEVDQYIHTGLMGQSFEILVM